MNELPEVVHMSSNHDPFDVRIFMKECRTLAAHGYRVAFVVPHEGDEIRDGVAIRAVPLPRTRIGRMTRTAWRVYRASLERDADIYHLHDPELIPYGWLLKLRGKTVVYDVHEHRPKQIMSKAWIHPWLRRPVAACVSVVEALSGRAFDRTIAVTKAVAEQFPPHKTTIVQNYPMQDEFAPPHEPHGSSRTNVMAFVGGISEIRGIKQMVASLGLLPKELEAELVLAGVFSSPGLEEEVRAMREWSSVTFLGWQSREEVAELLATARGGLVLYHPEPNHIDAQPNKLFEYMSAGVPVIASAFPLWRDVIERADCGLTVDPLDPRAIADAMTWLLAHPQEGEAMGARGREAVLARYNWSSQAQELLRAYEGLVR